MTTPSREEAPERVLVATDSVGVRVWLDDSDDLDEFTDVTEYLRADLANREPSEAITVDSTVYGQQFYGILNAGGQFWTPLAFESRSAARAHVAHFWSTPEQFTQFMRGAKIVPVHVQLTAIQAPEEKP
jgi:hypothetical protein